VTNVVRHLLLQRTVQVRFDFDTLRALEGHNAATRSDVIRDAIRAYVDPLVARLDGGQELDWSAHGRHMERPESFGSATSVRVAADLLERMDRVEANARGLGHRHVSRSSLIRDSVRHYLTKRG